MGLLVRVWGGRCRDQKPDWGEVGPILWTLICLEEVILRGRSVHSAIKTPTPLTTAVCVCVVSQPGPQPALQSHVSDGLHLTSPDAHKHL